MVTATPRNTVAVPPNTKPPSVGPYFVNLLMCPTLISLGVDAIAPISTSVLPESIAIIDTWRGPDVRTVPPNMTLPVPVCVYTVGLTPVAVADPAATPAPLLVADDVAAAVLVPAAAPVAPMTVELVAAAVDDPADAPVPVPIS